MNIIRKTIVVSTLAFVAIFFHILFCDWEIGASHQYLVKAFAGKIPNDSRLVVSFGPFAGIYARSLSSHTIDAVLGVAFPVVLIAMALFTLAGPRSNDQAGSPGS